MEYTDFFPVAPYPHLIPPTPSHSANDDLVNLSPPNNLSPFNEYHGHAAQPMQQHLELLDGYDHYSAADAQHHGVQQSLFSHGPPTPPTLPNGGFGLAQQQPVPTPAPGPDANDQRARQSSNSDEDLTPAQARRKLQNREAQRAFRERKEQKVKKLESEVDQLKQAQQDTVNENEQLRRDLQKMSTENEILKATSSIAAANGPGGLNMSAGGSGNGSSADLSSPTITGPMSYNPTDFYTELLEKHDNKTPSHRVILSENGQRLLAAGATWDYILSHDLFRRGLVDVADVSNMLKDQVRCDGQGPVFEEGAIREAIERSAVNNSDELI